MQRCGCYLRALAVIALCSAASGCSGRPPAVTLAQPQHPWTAKNYYRALERWTRDKAITVIAELNTTLRVSATLFSPEFNTAYAAKRARMFKLPRREQQQLEQRLARLWQQSYPFVMITATHDARWNDFERRNSQWRLWLTNDRGERVAPLAIERTRKLSQTEVALFPHLQMFYQFYKVRFPKKLPSGRPLVRGNTRRLKLIVTGSLGTASLVWRLQ
jgi:hypothetical protein